MVEAVVCPAREKSILVFSHHQNPLIHASSIRIECLQPVDGRQIEAGIKEGHQLPVNQIPVAFGTSHAIFRQFDGVLGSDIDQRLGNRDLALVNDIAEVKVNGQKTINFYSFATKYCSHHFPEDYPIYDSFVEKMLMPFKRVDKFYRCKKDDLKHYPA